MDFFQVAYESPDYEVLFNLHTKLMPGGGIVCYLPPDTKKNTLNRRMPLLDIIHPDAHCNTGPVVTGMLQNSPGCIEPEEPLPWLKIDKKRIWWIRWSQWLRIADDGEA